MEQFHWTDTDIAQVIKTETRVWRRLLGVGGRAPVDAVAVLLRIDSCILSWRSRRVAHFIRLLNSPADSLHYAALLVFYQLRTQWFLDVMADINLLYPTLRVQLTSSSVGPILQSNGWWADGDIWACLHPYQMPRDMLGFRLRTPLSHGTSLQEVRWIKHHAKWWADQVSYRLRTEASTQSLLSLMTRAGASEYSKTGFLAAKLTCPGPPLDICLDWISLEVHRRAVSGLFVGDWFLAM